MTKEKDLDEEEELERIGKNIKELPKDSSKQSQLSKQKLTDQ